MPGDNNFSPDPRQKMSEFSDGREFSDGGEFIELSRADYRSPQPVQGFKHPSQRPPNNPYGRGRFFPSGDVPGSNGGTVVLPGPQYPPEQNSQSPSAPSSYGQELFNG